MPLIFLLIIKSRYNNITRARLLQLQLTVTLYSDNFKDFKKIQQKRGFSMMN